MHEDMICYVKDFFEKHDEYVTDLPEKLPFRSRFKHVMRVYGWAERILAAETGADAEVVLIAAIFHDIGKGVDKNRPHALVSAEMCRHYLQEKNYQPDFIERVCSAIRNHSSKSNTDIPMPIEDSILIDADMLDESGALSVLWDSMTVALEKDPSYDKVYKRTIQNYIKSSRSISLFRTSAGKKYYCERIQFIKSFADSLEYEFAAPSCYLQYIKKGG